MHGITEEFLAGRLTLSRVLSGVCAALYLSLIFQPSSEDVCPRQSQRTMGTEGCGSCDADEWGLQELEGIVRTPTSHSAISKQMGTTPEFSR